jgi:hypothetical protein
MGKGEWGGEGFARSCKTKTQLGSIEKPKSSNTVARFVSIDFSTSKVDRFLGSRGVGLQIAGGLGAFLGAGSVGLGHFVHLSDHDADLLDVLVLLVVGCDRPPSL